MAQNGTASMFGPGTLRSPRYAPQREVFTVQRLVANRADIIWLRTGASEGVNEAVSLGPGRLLDQTLFQG